MTGQTISHYRLLDKLGAGGMGVVYKAEDTRLGRPVAIKFLHQSGGTTLDLARFHREARAASILNHPNICTVYDIGEHDGQPFLVMECLEGRTLADQIDAKRLPVETAVELAWQCADALAAAHSQNLMHRDIKPANIFVTSRGDDLVAKILDFGLAKTSEADGQGVGDQTETADSLTTPGSTVGTVAYMSPEQARGEKLDARTDIFSLGCVLYEMTTGVRPFTGSSQAVVFDGILNRMPDAPSRLNSAVPSELDAIILKALQKKPGERHQSAAELRSDSSHLRHGISGSPSGAPLLTATPPRSTWVKYVWVATVAIVGLGVYMMSRRSEPRAAGTITLTQITDSGHIWTSPGAIALSPDGKYLAYVELRGIEYRLFTRQLAGGAAVQVLGPELGPEKSLSGVTFSPDSNSIYAIRTEDRKGVLYLLPVLGGPLRKVVADIASPVAFSSDGTRMAFARYERGAQPGQATSSIVVANPDGSAERIVTTDTKRVFRKVRWSPDGKTIAAIVMTFGIVLVPSDGGTPVEFKVPGWRQLESLEWLRSGKGFLVTAEDQSAGYNAHHQVLEVSYPEAKVTRVTNDLSDHHEMSVAANGTSMVLVDLVNASNIWVGPAADPDKAVKIIGGRSQSFRGVAWTKDGRLVFGDEASTGYVMNADGSGLRLFSADRQVVRLPRECGPGPLLSFISGSGDKGTEISVGDPDGGAVRNVVTDALTPSPACTPDGAFMLSSKRDGIWKTPLTGKNGDPGTRLFENAYLGIVSPDSKWIAMYQRLSGPGGEVKIAVKSMTGGADARFGDLSLFPFDWLPDSSGLVYQKLEGEAGSLWTRPLGGGPDKQLTHAASDYVLSFAYSSDGRLAVVRGAQTRDVELIERK